MIKQLADLQRSEFIRNSVRLLSLSTLAQLVPILIYPIITRLYSPQELGVVALFMSLCGILATVAGGRYEEAILLPRSDRRAFSLVNLISWLALFISILFTLSGLLFGKVFAQWLNEPGLARWMPLVGLGVFLTTIYQALTYWCIRKKAFTVYGSNALNQSVTNSLVKIAAGFAGYTHSGLIWGTLAGQTVSLTALIYRLRNYIAHFGYRIKRRYANALMYSYRNFPKFRMLHALSNNLSGSIPFFVLTAWFTSTASGYYSLALTFGFRPVQLLSGTLNQVISQKISEKGQQAQPIYLLVIRFIRNMALLAFAPMLIAGLIAPWGFNLVFGKEWITSATHFQIILPWMFMVLIAGSLSFIPVLYGKQREAMLIDFGYLLLRIAALSIGVWFKNLNLALILFSTTGVVVAVLTLIWYLRLCKKLIPKTK